MGQDTRTGIKCMFYYTSRIHLRDTDATGVLFFTEQLRLALEAFEEAIRSQGIALMALLEELHCLMPIVHAEADYFSSLEMEDLVEIAVKLERIGRTSFTLHYQFSKPEDAAIVGTASIVHVTISKETKTKIPLPHKLITLLQGLGNRPQPAPIGFETGPNVQTVHLDGDLIRGQLLP